MFARLGRVIGYFSDTPLRTFAVVTVCAVVFAMIEAAIHVAMRVFLVPSQDMLLIDSSVVGLSGGTAVWVLLRGNRERRRGVRRELKRIGELNHEVRNALQVISHSHFDANDERREMVFQSIDRIDGALKRLFPVVGGRSEVAPMRKREEHSQNPSASEGQP